MTNKAIEVRSWWPYLSLYRSPWWTAQIWQSRQVTFSSLTVLSCHPLYCGIKREGRRELWPSTHKATLPCPAGPPKPAMVLILSFISSSHKRYLRPHHHKSNLSLSIRTCLHHTYPKTKTNKPKRNPGLPVSTFVFPSSP